MRTVPLRRRTAIGAAVLVAPAAAQIQTGSLLVRVLDEQGFGCSGRDHHDHEPGHAARGRGRDRLERHLSGARPWRRTYIVKTSLQGFQTLIREGVVVTQAQTTSIDSDDEGERALGGSDRPAPNHRSSTPRARTSTSISTRSCWKRHRAGRTSGTSSNTRCRASSSTRPTSAGIRPDCSAAFPARGTPNAQNTQLLNGVNVGDPAAIGFSMNYYDPSSFDEHPGVERRAGHLRGHVGRRDQHGHQERHQPVDRPGAADVSRQPDAVDNIDASLKAAGFRPDANALRFSQTPTSRLADR